MQYVPQVQNFFVNYYQTHHWGNIGSAVIAAEIGGRLVLTAASVAKLGVQAGFYKFKEWKDSKPATGGTPSKNALQKVKDKVDKAVDKVKGGETPEPAPTYESKRREFGEELVELGKHLVNFIPMALAAVHPVAGIAIPVLLTATALLAEKKELNNHLFFKKYAVTDYTVGKVVKFTRAMTQSSASKIEEFINNNNFLRGVKVQVQANTGLYFNSPTTTAVALSVLAGGVLLGLSQFGMNPLDQYKFVTVHFG